MFWSFPLFSWRKVHSALDETVVGIMPFHCAVLSHVWLFVTLWTIACQVPLSMGILQARILEWAAYPFSRGSSWPRNQTGVSCIASRFFTSWATREAHYSITSQVIQPAVTLNCRYDLNQKLSDQPKVITNNLNFTWYSVFLSPPL